MSNTPITDEDIDRLARRRAGAKLGWYSHATVYVLVNLGLYLASAEALGTRAWSIKPVLGWGLGLLMHGIAVFVLGSGSNLRERMVHKERERLLRERNRL